MPELIELPEKDLFHVFNIMLLENKHRLVKQLKKSFAPNVYGHKTWASSFLLMDYIQTHRILDRNSSVLELGCGWGAASIYCAKNGAKSVTGLDIDENVFPYLEVQAALNGVKIKTLNKSYQKLNKRDLQKFSMLVGADICFWNDLAILLENLFKKALEHGVERILLVDPGRQPFLDLADRCKAFAEVHFSEWYVCDPDYYDGYVLDLRPKGF